jgi:hypothetical protein
MLKQNGSLLKVNFCALYKKVWKLKYSRFNTLNRRWWIQGIKGTLGVNIAMGGGGAGSGKNISKRGGNWISLIKH